MTKRSRRRIELSAVATEALSRHRTRQLEQRVAAANLWQDRGLAFCNVTGNYLLAPQVLVGLPDALERAGLPRVRFHDLRHTAATLLLSQGIHPKIVSEMLGHSRVAITLDLYSHVTPTMQREAADAMDVIISGR
jgi:integrase